MPVGAALPELPGGIATTSDCGRPLPSKSVEVDVPLFATQTKPCGLKAMPQALTRCGSAFELLYGLLAVLIFETRWASTKPLLLPMLGLIELPPPPQEATAIATTQAVASPRTLCVGCIVISPLIDLRARLRASTVYAGEGGKGSRPQRRSAQNDKDAPTTSAARRPLKTAGYGPPRDAPTAATWRSQPRKAMPAPTLRSARVRSASPSAPR